MTREFTVVMVAKDGRVLLGYKKAKIGKGLWVGFGGKVESGESHEQAAVRELEEESGVKAEAIEYAGVVWATHEEHDEKWKISIYKVTMFSGEPKETSEMKPRWFKINEVPYNQMWEGDKYWMPMFLAGKIFEIKEHYRNEEGKVPELLNYDLREVVAENIAI